MTEISATPRAGESSEPVSELFEELPSPIARGLVYLLLALLVAAFLYAAIGRVAEIVPAPARVVPHGLARPIQAAAGGRVTRVAVREGETVRRDQALVYLEAETAAAQLERAEAERAMRQRQLQELLSGGGPTGGVPPGTSGAAAVEARAALARAEAEVDAARRALEGNILLAPADGQITRLALRGPGETVQPGQTVAELAPAGAPLVFEALVPNSAVGRVRLGQEVRVKVDAYPHQRWGTVEGRVSYVSPDALTGGPAGAGGDSSYRVLITPAPDQPAGPRGVPPLRLGLTATAEIVTGRPRILELLLKSLRGEE